MCMLFVCLFVCLSVDHSPLDHTRYNTVLRRTDRLFTELLSYFSLHSITFFRQVNQYASLISKATDVILTSIYLNVA